MQKFIIFIYVLTVRLKHFWKLNVKRLLAHLGSRLKSSNALSFSFSFFILQTQSLSLSFKFSVIFILCHFSVDFERLMNATWREVKVDLARNTICFISHLYNTSKHFWNFLHNFQRDDCKHRPFKYLTLKFNLQKMGKLILF